MDNKASKLNYLANMSFFFYFLILLGERTASFILSIVNKVDIFGNAFNGYVYIMVILSILGWAIFLAIKCRDNIKALFTFKEVSFINLSIAAGILLLSGMVHTEYTTGFVQFISYGLFIVGILLITISKNKESNNKVSLWLFFAYLVTFSMAVPVMYHSNIELHVLFHIIEAVAALSLVGVFTYLLILLINDKYTSFRLVPLLVMVVLDTTLVILRWNEMINLFVLIFEILSVVIFIIGFIYNLKKKAK